MTAFGHEFAGDSWRCLHCGAWIGSIDAITKCPGPGAGQVTEQPADDDAGERLMRAIREAGGS